MKNKPSQPAFRDGAFVEVWVETKILVSPGGKQVGTAHPGRSLTVLDNGELNGVKYLQVVDRAQHLTGWVRANELKLHEPSDRPMSADVPAKQTPKPSTIPASPSKKSDAKSAEGSMKSTYKKDQRVEVQTRVGIYDSPGGKLVEVVDAGEILTVKSSQFVNEEEYVWVLDPVVSVSGWIRAHQIKPVLETSQQSPRVPVTDPPAAKQNRQPRPEAPLPKFYPGLDVVTTAKASMVNKPGDKELLARKIGADAKLMVLETASANGISYVRVFDPQDGTYAWTREANLRPAPVSAAQPFKKGDLTQTITPSVCIWTAPGKVSSDNTVVVFTTPPHYWLKPLKVIDTYSLYSIQWLWLTKDDDTSWMGWFRASDVKAYTAPKPTPAIEPATGSVNFSEFRSKYSLPSSLTIWRVGQMVKFSIVAQPKLMVSPSIVSLKSAEVPINTPLQIQEISTVSGVTWLRVKALFSLLPSEGWVRSSDVFAAK
ncbi:MAG: hypothetical protein U0670_02490 [Anaerolineae bacterium]